MPESEGVPFGFLRPAAYRVFDAPEPEAAQQETPADSGDEVPDGTITEVKAWVGEDPDRAQAALDAEGTKDNPRVTLVEYLQSLTG